MWTYLKIGSFLDAIRHLKMLRWGLAGIEWASNPVGLIFLFLKTEKFRHETYTQGESYVEWSVYKSNDVKDCKQTTRICEKARKDSSTGFKGNMALPQSWFRLLTSRIMTPYTSVVLIHPACGPEGSLGILILVRGEMEVHMEKLHRRLRQIFLC